MADTPALLRAEVRGRPGRPAFQIEDYLDLVDWSGRVVREDKKRAIPEDPPPILECLNIDPETWIKTIRQGRRLEFDYAVRRASKIRQAADTAGRQFFKGVTLARQLFPEPG